MNRICFNECNNMNVTNIDIVMHFMFLNNYLEHVFIVYFISCNLLCHTYKVI